MPLEQCAGTLLHGADLEAKSSFPNQSVIKSMRMNSDLKCFFRFFFFRVLKIVGFYCNTNSQKAEGK